MILAESAIDSWDKESHVIVVDDDDTNTPELAHNSTFLQSRAIEENSAGVPSINNQRWDGISQAVFCS
jgi:hypothetical protein